jgi:hypothetical protein
VASRMVPRSADYAVTDARGSYLRLCMTLARIASYVAPPDLGEPAEASLRTNEGDLT